MERSFLRWPVPLHFKMWAAEKSQQIHCLFIVLGVPAPSGTRGCLPGWDMFNCCSSLTFVNSLISQAPCRFPTLQAVPFHPAILAAKDAH